MQQQQTMHDVCKPFQGERKPAMARIRRLVALACEHLPAAQINCLSFHIALYVDVEVGHRNLTGRLREELDAERSKGSSASPADLSPADRKLLRQFGIKS